MGKQRKNFKFGVWGSKNPTLIITGKRATLVIDCDSMGGEQDYFIIKSFQGNGDVQCNGQSLNVPAPDSEPNND